MQKKVKAYAKINIGLRVGRKKRNGYHKIKTIMSKIELHDVITFRESDEIVVEMSKNICAMKDNLCFKVADYLKNQYGVHNGIHIYIEKNIPSGGGLGGGSSDAAETLKFLNDFWNLKLSTRKLIKIGKLFGCDIPFFLKCDLGYGYNYGEKIIKINKQINQSIILLLPPFSLATKEVYQTFKINEKEKKVDNNYKILKEIFKNRKILSPYNELEMSADAVSQGEMKKMLDFIRERKVICSMTGSGSTIVVYAKEYCENICEELSKGFPGIKNIETKLKVYSY